MLDTLMLNNLFYIMMAWAAAFLAALWLSLVIWTARDIRARTRDPLLRILAVLVVLVLFAPGIFVYLILRPPKTLEDEYQQTLEEEALLQTIEDAQLCPGCGRRIEENWQVCPNCHTKLRKPCHHCDQLMELSWNLCPYCGKAVPGIRQEYLEVDEDLRGISLDDVDLVPEPAVSPPEDLEQEVHTADPSDADEGEERA